MAKGQMRSNKEKKKPKADKNIKKGGATPSPFSSGKMQMQAGQNPMGKKSRSQARRLFLLGMIFSENR